MVLKVDYFDLSVVTRGRAPFLGLGVTAIAICSVTGVSGEAWTCDGQTNAKHFIELVCSSFLDGIG